LCAEVKAYINIRRMHVFKCPGNRYNYPRLFEIEDSLWKNKKYSEDYTEHRQSCLHLWQLPYF